MVDHCGCCLQRQGENSQRFKKGELELEDHPGAAFDSGALCSRRRTPRRCCPSHGPTSPAPGTSRRSWASRRGRARAGSPPTRSSPSASRASRAPGFHGRHAVRLGIEGGADHLRSVVSYNHQAQGATRPSCRRPRVGGACGGGGRAHARVQNERAERLARVARSGPAQDV